MIEEVDAALAAHLWNGILICIFVVSIGCVIDFGMFPWLQRHLDRIGWRVVGVLVRVLRFQALVQALILGTLVIIINSGAPAEIVYKVSRIGIILAILELAITAMRFATGLVRMSLSHHHRATISLVNVLIRVVSILLITTFALTLFGVPITPLLTVIAGSSVGLSLALRDPLTNLFAGLQILADGRLQPGGYVQLSTGEAGYIVDIRWSDTTIRQLTNNIVIVPNIVLTTTRIVNYDLPEPEQSLEIPIQVAYASDLPHVEQITLDIAKEVQRHVQGGVKEWQPFIRYSDFTAALVRFSVTLRVQGFADQQLVKHEFIRQLHERYMQEQINLPAVETAS